MGAVAVAQHLHAMIVLINNNNVTCGIERDTRGIVKLAGACSFTADGAEMRAVAVAQNLNTMVVIVGNNKIAFAVKRNTTMCIKVISGVAELPVAAAPASDGADAGAVAQPMHLHTVVATVIYSNVALAVNRDAPGRVELSVAPAIAADGDNMSAVAVAQDLHAMIATVRYNDVPRAIKRYAPGFIELPIPCSFAADGAHLRTIDVAKHLNAMVVTIGHHQVALAVKRNATRRKIELPITSTFAANDAHAACTRSCNSPQPPRQLVTPRQNAGGLPHRMRDGACVSETHEPHGKRHAQAAAGKQTLPLFRRKLQANCALLCGSGMKEGWALGEGGLQLLLADLESPYKCGAGFKCPRFNTDVKATLQLPALAAAHGDAQRLHVQAAAGVLLMGTHMTQAILTAMFHEGGDWR